MDELENDELQAGMVKQSEAAVSPVAEAEEDLKFLLAGSKPEEEKPPIDIQKLQAGDPEQVSLWEKTKNAASEIGDVVLETGKTAAAVALGPAAGMVADLAGAPEIKQRQQQFSAGAWDKVQDFGNGVIDVAESIGSAIAGKGFNDPTPEKTFSFADDWFPAPKTPGERNARAVGSFAASMAAFVGGGAAAKAWSASKYVQGAAAVTSSAAINFFAFDPKEEKLQGLVKEIPGVRDILPDWLNAQEGDTELDLRFKNAVNGAIDDAAVAAAFIGIAKTYKQFRGISKVVNKSPLEEKILQAVPEGEVAPAVSATGEPLSTNKPKTLVEGKQPPPQLDLTKSPLTPTPEQKAYLDKGMERAKLSFGEGPGARQFMEEHINRNWDNIVKRKDGIHTAEVRAQLKEGLNVDDLLDPSTGKILDDAQTEVLSEFIDSNINEMLAAVDASDPEKAFEKLIETHEMLAPYTERVIGSTSEAARTMQVTQKFKDSNAVRKWIKEKAAMAATPEERAKIVEQIAEIVRKDPKKALKKIGEIIEPVKKGSYADAVYGVWYSNMLGNPETWGKNAFGNTVQLQKNIAERYVGATANFWKGGGEISFKEANIKAQGAMESMLDGIKAMFGKDKIKFQRKVVGFKRAAFGKNFSKFETEYAANTFDKLPSPVAAVFEVPFKILNQTDEFFKVVSYSSETKAIAYRQARKEAVAAGEKGFDIASRMEKIEGDLIHRRYDRVNTKAVQQAGYQEAKTLGLKGVEADKHVLKKVQAAREEADLMRDINDQALLNAKKNTYTAAPRADGAQEAVLNAIERIPLAKVVVPFSKVTTNVMKEVLESTPVLANISKDYRMAVAAGGAAKELAHAKVQLGGSLIAMGALASRGGYVTGSEPLSPTTRKARIAAGEKFNSFKIGNTWFSLDSLGAVGDILRMGADVNEWMGYVTDAEQDKLAATTSFLGSQLVELLSPDFAKEGVFEVLSLVREKDEDKVTAFVSGLTRSTVPGGLRFLKRNLPESAGGDSTKRVTRGDTGYKSWKDVAQQTLREFQANTPFLGSKLPPARNYLGEVVTHPPGLGPRFLSAIALSEKPGKNDVVFDEIARLGLASSFMREDLPEGEEELRVDVPPRYILKDGVKIDLDPVIHDRYQRLCAGYGLGTGTGDEVNPGVGTLRDSLTSLIKNNYQDAEGVGQEGIILGGDSFLTDQNKRESIKAVQKAYRDAAKEQLLEEYPQLVNKLGEGLKSKAKARGINVEGLGEQ